jgi:hypothetical protein
MASIPTSLDTPALPAVGTRQIESPSMDAANADPAGIDAPLPTLRVPAAHAVEPMTEEDIAPLPTIRAARQATPISFEPEDENAIVIGDTREIHTLQS